MNVSLKPNRLRKFPEHFRLTDSLEFGITVRSATMAPKLVWCVGQGTTRTRQWMGLPGAAVFTAYWQ